MGGRGGIKFSEKIIPPIFWATLRHCFDSLASMGLFQLKNNNKKRLQRILKMLISIR